MSKSILGICSILVIAAGFVAADGYYHHVEAQAAADTAAQLDAGVADPSVAQTHLDGAGPVVAPPVAPVLPDPVAQPAEAAGMTWKLYKDGALAPALILGAFFVLLALRSKIAWLRTGHRAAITASLLVASTMLAERAASGATPNLSMVVSAIVAGALLYVRGDKGQAAGV